MNASRLVRRFLLVLCLAMVAASLSAQAPATKQQFEPEVGQAGKDVVWVPTSEALVAVMLDLAEVTPKDYVIDLGSGDGRTVIAAAKRGARALGIEYNPDMVELSRRNATTAGIGDKVTFVQADLFASDFSQATVVTMFLLPNINLKLRPKILDMKPGTRIVSNTFTMGEWEADRTENAKEGCSSWCTALLWIVPAKVEGTWRLPQGELTLKQTFQKLSGTLRSGSDTAPISGQLNGDQISFSVEAAEYAGHVNGSAMEGTVKSTAGNGAWRATRTTG